MTALWVHIYTNPWKRAGLEKPLRTKSRPEARYDWLNCLYLYCLMASALTGCASNVSHYWPETSFFTHYQHDIHTAEVKSHL